MQEWVVRRDAPAAGPGSSPTRPASSIERAAALGFGDVSCHAHPPRAGAACSAQTRPVALQRHVLLDTLMARMKLRSDGDLHQLLAVPWSMVRKIRQRQLAVGSCMLVRMHHASGMSLRELKALLAASQ